MFSTQTRGLPLEFPVPQRASYPGFTSGFQHEKEKAEGKKDMYTDRRKRDLQMEMLMGGAGLGGARGGGGNRHRGVGTSAVRPMGGRTPEEMMAFLQPGVLWSSQ